MIIASCLSGGRRAATDLDGPLVVAADELHLDGELDGRKGLDQLVGRRDGLPADLHDEIATLDPGGGRRRALLDTTHEHALALGQADGPAHPRGDVARGHGHAEPLAARRLTPAEGIDAVAERSVCRKREVEALADAVRVDPD